MTPEWVDCHPESGVTTPCLGGHDPFSRETVVWKGATGFRDFFRVPQLGVVTPEWVDYNPKSGCSPPIPKKNIDVGSRPQIGKPAFFQVRSGFPTFSLWVVTHRLRKGVTTPNWDNGVKGKLIGGKKCRCRFFFSFGLRESRRRMRRSCSSRITASYWLWRSIFRCLQSDGRERRPAKTKNCFQCFHPTQRRRHRTAERSHGLCGLVGSGGAARTIN